MFLCFLFENQCFYHLCYPPLCMSWDRASRGRKHGERCPLTIQLGVQGSVISFPSGVQAEPRPKMDFMHILHQKEAIFSIFQRWWAPLPNVAGPGKTLPLSPSRWAWFQSQAGVVCVVSVWHLLYVNNTCIMSVKYIIWLIVSNAYLPHYNDWPLLVKLSWGKLWSPLQQFLLQKDKLNSLNFAWIIIPPQSTPRRVRVAGGVMFSSSSCVRASRNIVTQYREKHLTDYHRIYICDATVGQKWSFSFWGQTFNVIV